MFEMLFNPSQEKQEEPKENDIEVLQKQVATLEPKDLKVLAEEKAIEIFSNIQKISDNIDYAKSLTKRAENAKGGLFGLGKTKEKTELNTKAISMQSEAMAEMNTLIQESIKLTTISYGFAQAMTQTIAAMLENGFKDRDGNMRQLHGVAEEQALIMLGEAQKFVKHQQEYEERQERQEEQISALQSGIETHKQEYEKRQTAQETNITSIQATLKEKDSLDNRQDEQIQQLKSQLKSKKSRIDKQEQELHEIHKIIDELYRQQAKKESKTPLVFAGLAFLLSIASLGLTLLR